MKRMCADYSQTVNKFTCLDAYPLPNMQIVFNNVTQYKWYSSLDFRSAHHQVPLLPERENIRLSKLMANCTSLRGFRLA